MRRYGSKGLRHAVTRQSDATVTITSVLLSSARKLGKLAILAAAIRPGSSLLMASEDSPIEPVVAAQPTPVKAHSDDRILGVIPNYQTVSDPDSVVKPLTVKEKWKLALRESLDPFTAGNALMGAGFSQSENSHPKYGGGSAAYAQRFGAAMGDFATQNLFSAGILASMLHQDPRYFRRGPKSGLVARVGYSISRIAVTRTDSGKAAFNVSGLLGMSLGIAASNLYYPRSSVSGSVVESRFGTSLMGAVTGNLLSEFWPDIHQRLLRVKTRFHKPRT